MAYFIPRTGEISVNTDQIGDQSDASITGLADGGFVVVWSTSASDYDPVYVMMQRYDAAGEPVGDNMRVNAGTGAGQVHDDPQVELLDDGSWVVVWEHFNFLSFPQSHHILAQVFDADGTRKGDEFTVVSDAFDRPSDASVTALENGRFFVSWQSNGAPYGRANEIRAHVCDAQGPVSEDVVLNTGSGDFQNTPIVTTLSNGQLVLVWSEAVDIRPDQLLGTSVFAQLLTPGGESIADAFEVFQDRGQRSVTDVVALPSGEFLVVGNGSPLGGQSTSIVVQRFSNDGAFVEDTFIKPDTGEAIYNAQLAALPDGGYALTYSVLVEDRNFWDEQTDTFMVRFNAFGRQFADPYKVNVQSDTGYNSNHSDVAVLADGNVVVAWQGREQLNYVDQDVYARIYNADMYGTGLWDYLVGTDFDDTIFGLGFNDFLMGEAGDDHLIGGRSDDTLDGGIGDDILNGGGGWDEFRFSSGEDRIVRFDDNRDRIVLDGAALGVVGYSASQIIDTFGAMRGDTAVIDFGEGNILRVSRAENLNIFVDDLIIA